MYFKAIFNNPIEESAIDSLEVDFSPITGNEVIYYKNHEFEIERDDSGAINILTFYNQCVQTFDIEDVFFELIDLLLTDDTTVLLVDSNGYEEIFFKEELPQN